MPTDKQILYDVIIIGAGISGLATAYTLYTLKPNLNILILEQGPPLKERICQKNSTCSYSQCTLCPLYSGFGGLGKSEGKYNFCADFGGHLASRLGLKNFYEYQKKLENFLLYFSNSIPLGYSSHYGNYTKKMEQLKVKLIPSKTLHLGTKGSLEMLSKIEDFVFEHMDCKCNTKVLQIEKENDFILTTTKKTYHGHKVIIATGNQDSDLIKMLNVLGIEKSSWRVDLGIRIETDIKPFKPLLNEYAEFKLTKTTINQKKAPYTYCMNPYGYVIQKTYQRHLFTDGQNYREKNVKSKKINFAVLTPFYFNTQKKYKTFMKNLLHQIDIHTKDGTFHQMIGDFDRDYIPSIIFENSRAILRDIEELFNLKLSIETQFHGLEIKTFSPEVLTDHTFQTNIENLFVIGDCSGATWSLAESAMSGLYLGEHI